MPDTSTYLFTQGVLGVVCFVQGWVIVKLYKAKEASDAANTAQSEKRRLDAIESRDAVLTVLPGLVLAVKNIGDKIEITRLSRRDGQ